MASMDMCRVVNKGKTEFSATYANNRFVIKKGKTAVVPRDAVNLWFGDPDTRDDPNDRSRYYRTAEFARLRIKYGVYDGVPGRQTMEEAWEERTPKVEVYDLDDNRLYTVVEDPEGLESAPAPTPSRMELNLAAQLEDMERQMTALKRAIADAEAGEASGLGRSRTEGEAAEAENDLDPDSAADPADDDEPPPVTEDKPTKVRGTISRK